MSTIEQTQTELVDEFQLFDNWMDRYQYIIDLGKRLPPFPPEWQTEDFRLHGCQSQVWLKADRSTDRLDFHAISDSAIVSGLIAILMRVYSGRSPAEIVATPPDFIDAIGLHEHLSPTRSNGLHAMIDAIKGHAAQCAG
ncbi:MAG: SufE family protein [Gammaproteobacteria bacterium]|jgi:cysteine desulfuration protein SufE